MARGRVRTGEHNGTASDETRARILDATLETIRTEGMLGTSARAIARTGNFNQASIYYHFGSIDTVVLAALRSLSESCLARYAERLTAITSLADLVEVGATLHREDTEGGAMAVLAQVMSAAAGDPAFGKEVGAIFRPWVEVLSSALRRVLGRSPLAGRLDVDALAYATSALFVGFEMVGHLRLRGDGDEPEPLWASVGGLTRVIDSLLGPAPASAPAPT